MKISDSRFRVARLGDDFLKLPISKSVHQECASLSCFFMIISYSRSQKYVPKP